MKKLLVLTLVVGMSIFLFVSCLSLNNEPVLLLSHVEWYATTEEIGDLTFGYVHLSLGGLPLEIKLL